MPPTDAHTLEALQADFLERARAAGCPGAEEFSVRDGDEQGTARAWRIDVNISLGGQSFLLTTDGAWCTAVRVAGTTFGWGVIPAHELEEALRPWAGELANALQQQPI